MEKKFRNHNFELFLVGGAVRNIVLGRKPVDWDLASNATPAQVIKLFRHVIPTGINHGTVTIRFKRQSYEITTYRIDGTYSDSRRPDSVEYTANIYEDLKRRDFTINAMAYSLRHNKLIDPHGGRRDIANQLVRTVGNPLERFSEDGLRIIRGLRFATALNFKIDPDTFSAMKKRLNYLETVSIERIRDEFNKILLSPRPSRGIELIRELGALSLFSPELEACANFHRDSLPRGRDLYAHLLCVCDYLPDSDLEMRFAGLFHDVGIPQSSTTRGDGTTCAPGHERISSEIAGSFCKRFKYPNAFEKRSCALISHHMFQIQDGGNAKQVRRFIHRVGRDLVFDLLNFKNADLAGKKGPFYDETCSEKKLLTPPEFPEIAKTRKTVIAIFESDNALSIKDLAVNGNDLHSKAGIPRSRIMGTILELLLEAVLDDPAMNTPERLIHHASEIYRQKIRPLQN